MFNNTIKQIAPDVITWRRYIHSHPELGMEVWGTADYVEKILRENNIEVIRFENMPAVVGILKGGKPGKVIALRADMDALPMQEEVDLPFKSVYDGKMHSCGHDMHTAILLGTAVTLAQHREEVKGIVKFFFQPAEEGPNPGGALPMIKAGVMENPTVDACFGMHVFPVGIPGGYSCKKGVVSSNSDTAVIKVIGKGGHGATPDSAIDPILVSMYIGIALQSIVSRNVSPMDSAVVSIGSIHSGTVANIIPASAEMKLSIRSFSNETREKLAKRIKEIAEGVSQSMGATCEIKYSYGYPMMVNNDKAVDYFVDIMGENRVMLGDKAMSGSEDFSYFLQKAPGAFIGLAAGYKDKQGFYNHHPKFNPNEDCLVYGIEAFVKLVMEQDKMDF